MGSTCKWAFWMAWVALIGALIVATFKRKRSEAFAAAADFPVLLSTNVLQHRQWAAARGLRAKAFVAPEGKWDETIESAAALTTAPNAFLLLDPLDAHRAERGSYDIESVPKGYFVALYSMANAMQVECSFDWGNKRVGYLDRSDLHFIHALSHGYRIRDKVRTVRVPITAWDNLDRLLDTELDVIVCYIIPGSDLHRLLQMQTLSMMGFRNLDAARIQAFYPFVQMEEVDFAQVMRDVPGSGLRFMAKERRTLLPSMRMVLHRIRGTLPPPPREGFEDLGRMMLDAPDPEELDPSFRCYGDPIIKQKALCESPVDVNGLPKRRRTVWDRPCIRNEDCPFWSKDRGRGGCLTDGGVCEMPVGVKRIAYRKYEAEGRNAPFCYGCDSNPGCCASQSRPDYVWPNDFAERKSILDMQV
jgi:hypothetical protein